MYCIVWEGKLAGEGEGGPLEGEASSVLLRRNPDSHAIHVCHIHVQYSNKKLKEL